MTDLKFEQKRSLSRLEAADQLTALAAALREGGDAELELGSGTLSLRIPDDLRSEVEVEIDNGEIELEIELTWPTTPPKRKKPPPKAAARTTTSTSKPKRKPKAKTTNTKRSATKKP
ncbi:amphi-Trp domain-containing protein [Streptomyces koelreuteriae]|uniref:Amphi-Trp domain-containing protein n=1 Tax=Streptomyces koelreuteriae TaxID=2838015 RepID=A0ABX8FVA6_9ACTN|nr:amphi-Trp domain-containing protein [Streptomyces koelreuteriae]QWB24999.1 amphi-Trp domain-containing protein [Streptomyces koelreuteriae]UUA08026.1 amphi-Trp domain-containing protein [Streptomyces koelreuteriae]